MILVSVSDNAKNARSPLRTKNKYAFEAPENGAFLKETVLNGMLALNRNTLINSAESLTNVLIKTYKYTMEKYSNET